jgi:hypothetical protein
MKKRGIRCGGGCGQSVGGTGLPAGASLRLRCPRIPRLSDVGAPALRKDSFCAGCAAGSIPADPGRFEAEAEWGNRAVTGPYFHTSASRRLVPENIRRSGSVGKPYDDGDCSYRPTAVPGRAGIGSERSRKARVSGAECMVSGFPRRESHRYMGQEPSVPGSNSTPNRATSWSAADEPGRHAAVAHGATPHRAWVYDKRPFASARLCLLHYSA